MSDPALQRFQRDALVQTHQRRIRELESYVQKIEKQLKDQQSNAAKVNDLNTLDLPMIMLTGDN